MGCSATAAPKRHSKTTARLIAMTVRLLTSLFPKGPVFGLSNQLTLSDRKSVGPFLSNATDDVHARSDFGLATGGMF